MAAPKRGGVVSGSGGGAAGSRGGGGGPPGRTWRSGPPVHVVATNASRRPSASSASAPDAYPFVPSPQHSLHYALDPYFAPQQHPQHQQLQQHHQQHPHHLRTVPSSPAGHATQHREHPRPPHRPHQPDPTQPLLTNWSHFPSYPAPDPTTWTWDNPFEVATSPSTPYGAPQGALAPEHQVLTSPARGYAVGFPPDLTPQSSTHPSPQVVPSAAPTPTSQNPLSPPPVPSHVSPRATMIQTGVKRKADSEPGSLASPATAQMVGDLPQPPSKIAKSRATSIAGNAPSVAASQLSEARTAAEAQGKQQLTGDDVQLAAGSESEAGTGSKDLSLAPAKARRIAEVSGAVTNVLPAGKVFSIQIGCELFRLSGASISSDAPSYFSHFFGEQLHNGPTKGGEMKTLYIDRDPATFRDIVLHLQGYHVRPRDAEHFVRLFADAQFYSLPRLTQQLFKSEIFVQIGDKNFQIPRDIFSAPGDSPNFFSLGFAHFFTTPSEVFPGLDRTSLLRPPSILPPAVPNRSGKVFGELVQLLKGYPVHIRDEGHRADLLRDARYFHLKGLEQRLLPHEISFNLIRNASEILIRLEDIRQSGVSFTPDRDTPATYSSSNEGQSKAPTPSPGESPSGLSLQTSGYVSYARPFTDDQAHTLIVEIGSPESTRLHFSPGPSPDALSIRATFVNQTLARISSLFQVVANKMGLPATQPLGLMMLQSGGGVAAQPVSPANSGVSGEMVKVYIGPDASVELDGEKLVVADHITNPGDSSSSPKLLKRNQRGSQVAGAEFGYESELVDAVDVFGPEQSSWVVRRGHWRLRMVPAEETGKMEVIMCAARIEAFSSEHVRNANRSFLA